MSIECSEIDYYRVCKVGETMIIGNNEGYGNAIVNHDLLPTDLKLASTYNNTAITEISAKAFFSAHVVNVRVGKFVQKIHESAFRHCIYLKEIIIPPSVQFIGEGGIRKATTESVASEEPFTVIFLPESKLEYLDNYAISGALTITVYYCGCRTPSFISESIFMQANTVNLFTPAPMNFQQFVSKVDPNKCYMYPVFDRYRCDCTIRQIISLHHSAFFFLISFTQ